jgi:nitric oxide reductase NorE protein
LILLTSSWLAAKAVILRGAGNIKRARSLIYGAATLGVFFGCSKAIEYGIKFSKGIYLATNPFFTYYFSLTGIHLVHVLVGVLVLIRFGRTMESSPSAFLESGVCYWHMVDLIWVILFPLLYLLH